MAELKPCPFCGGEGFVYGHGYAWVTCKSCKCDTRGYATRAEAVEAWNRRAYKEYTIGTWGKKAGDGNG